MLNVIGLSVELMMNPFILVTKPFVFLKVFCVLGVQVLIFACATWLTLVKSVIKIQIDVCWSVIAWAYYIMSLPIRIMTALQREKMLEMSLHKLQTQLENLTWENKQLEDCLDASFKECRVIETLFAKMEQEQDKALEKIDFLENELQDLREENLQVSEHQGKSFWDDRRQYGKRDSRVHKGVPLAWTAGYDDAEAPTPGDDPRASAEGLVEEAALEKRRYVALYRSTFSVVLSLLVGLIVWEAEDPCLPLVAALFTVVGMSLGSVVQFFSAIRNKPASDAVALLSFNWFVLGTLTSPSLPRLVRVLAPLVLRLGGRLLRKIGFAS
ncbi:unnamed protein product [Spirodela intermedia]|uniref:Uncharacterized protein n=1 Tax=Spirodela intermedia TaxID=51605 RepID=A0A7I8L1Q4_SPIIN|nr:unnamed protein product [Spirodela intermedia]